MNVVVPRALSAVRMNFQAFAPQARRGEATIKVRVARGVVNAF